MLSKLTALFTEHYRRVDPRWLGIFRVCFGCLLLSELCYRWSYARLLFSNDGVLPNHFSLFAPMGQDLFSIYHVFSTVEEVHIAFALTFVVFACFTVGYRTRLFHVLSALLITSLHSRNLFTENGDAIRIGAEFPSGLANPDVLAIARREQRILITDDRDFGELVFHLRQPHAGVIYLRLGDEATLATRTARLTHVLEGYRDQLDRFLIVSRHRVRVRGVAPGT